MLSSNQLAGIHSEILKLCKTFRGAQNLILGLHVLDKVDDAVGVAELVVVP